MSVVGCQLSVVSCQLSVVSCQLSVVSCWLLVIRCSTHDSFSANVNFLFIRRFILHLWGLHRNRFFA
ncbi:MAG: hypothetical protein ACKPA8_03205 [Dolichospermum sp.]